MAGGKVMKNRNEFKKQMAGVAEVFDKDLTGLLIDVYWKALINFNDEDCIYAFGQAILKGRFFPRPAELIKYINGRHPVPLPEDLARCQAHIILKIIRGDRTVIIKDPITKYLTQARFKIENLKASLMVGDEHWFMKDFVEAYCSFERLQALEFLKITDANRKLLGLIENIGD
jgi:hypothetical protein